MPFITVNGFEVLVWVRSGAENTVIIGDEARAYSGQLRGTRRAVKREWPFTVTIADHTTSEADALQALILGEGHYWSFDSDLYSSKGLGPQAGFTATQSGTGGKYGGKVDVTSLSYAAGLTDDWTVLVYRLQGSPLEWVYYAVRSDGAKWVDGTRDDLADTSWLTVDSGGVLTITDAPSRPFDELIALPYLATADMIVAWQALTVPFSSLPKLDVSGDFVRGKTVECLGALGAAPFVAPKWQRVEFTLREV